MALTDSITTCNMLMVLMHLTCCVDLFWNGSFWAKMGSLTSISETGLVNKKLIKIVDMLGRKHRHSNQTLFFIYKDGTIERRYIIDRN